MLKNILSFLFGTETKICIATFIFITKILYLATSSKMHKKENLNILKKIIGLDTLGLNAKIIKNIFL